MSVSSAQHSLMGGKLHVYRRENSGKWQCSTYLAGKNHRASIRTDDDVYERGEMRKAVLRLLRRERRFAFG